VPKLSSFVQKNRTKAAIFTTPLSKALGFKTMNWQELIKRNFRVKKKF
jgi:hypothetical protein